MLRESRPLPGARPAREQRLLATRRAWTVRAVRRPWPASIGLSRRGVRAAAQVRVVGEQRDLYSVVEVQRGEDVGETCFLLSAH